MRLANHRSMTYRPLLVTVLLAGMAAPAAAQQGNQSSYYWRPSLALQDVSTTTLTAWLNRLGVTLPFTISGDVSFSLNAAVPLTAFNDPTAYELDGYLSSPRLTIDNVVVEQIAVTLRYRDGAMALQAVRLQLPKREGESAAASLVGHGILPLVPVGDLHLAVSVFNFNLARLSEFSGVDLQLTGTASGRAEIIIAKGNFANPGDWSGSATLQASEVHTPGLYAPNAEAIFSLAAKTLTFERFAGVVNEVPLSLVGALSLSEDAKTVAFNDVQLDIFGGSVRLNGRVPVGQPTAQDITFDAVNLDLALLDRQLRPLANRLGLRGLQPLQGRISLGFDGTVPFQKLEDYSLWRLRRTSIASARILVGSTAFDNVAMAATFDGTRFSLNPFGWDWPAEASPDRRPGRMDASIAAQLTLFGRVDVRVQSTHTPVRPVLALFGMAEMASGFLNGGLTIGAPAVGLKTNPTSLATWTAALDLSGEALRIADLPIEFRRLRTGWRSPMFEVQQLNVALLDSPVDASGRVRLADDRSRLDVEQSQLMTEFGRAAATGTIPLDEDQPGGLSLRIEQGDAATLSRIVGQDVFSSAGPLDGSIQVALAPEKAMTRTLSTSGRLNGVIAGSFHAAFPLGESESAGALFADGRGSVDLTVAVPISILGRTITEAAIRADWKDGILDVARFGANVDGVPLVARGRIALTEEVVAAEQVQLDLLGGNVRGELRYPRRSNGTGRAQFTVSGVDIAGFKPFLSSPSPRLEGKIGANGTVEFQAAPNPNQMHPVIVAMDVEAPQLNVGNWRIRRTSGNVRTESGVATINLRGETLDGLFEWNGVEALPQGSLRGDDGVVLASRGSLSVRNIHLGRLAAAIPRRVVSEELIQGRLNGSLSYTRRPDMLPTGSGRAEIIGLANRTGPLSRRLTSSMTFDGQRLRLPDVNGDMLDGRLRGLVVLNTRDMRNGAFYRGEVRGMSLPRFFPQIGADGDLFTGVGDIEVRGRLSKAITGRGTIEISRGTLVGLDVSAWRSPAEIEVSLVDYSGSFAIPQSTAMLASGRLNGKLDYQWDTAARIDSTIDFANVSLRGLLGSSSRLQSYSEGRVTGRLHLGGRAMRNLNDLGGSFSARLENTQPGSWPVLDRVLGLLTGVGGRALLFDRGDVAGIIGGGAVRINRLELVSQRARVAGTGVVRFNGGLDMDFTAFTGRTTVQGRGGELLAAQLLVAANPSTAVLYRVNQLLSDRVIAVKVTGTIKAPQTRIKPVPTLTAEAARFLLAGFIPTPGATAAGGS
jgi:hypothetical protein